MTGFRALAGQSRVRMAVKAALSLCIVGLAAFFAREGPALAIIIIFTGVTGPSIRIVTMKMEGTYDRILVSPVPKPRFFVTFAGFWTITVLLPLVPALIVVAILDGLFIIIPVIAGILLASALGTLSGVVSKGLSEAHLVSLLVSAALIVLTVIRTPSGVILPYTYLPASPGPVALAASAVLPTCAILLLALVTSRPGLYR